MKGITQMFLFLIITGSLLLHFSLYNASRYSQNQPCRAVEFLSSIRGEIVSPPSDTSHSKVNLPSTSSPPKEGETKPTLANLPQSTNDTVRYHQLVELYHRTLAAIPKKKYDSREKHVITGSPLSSVLKNTSPDSVKRILAWTPFFDIVDWIPKVICKGEKHSCVSVTNRSELAKVDGIVVHPRDLKGKEDLPSKLLPHQRLVYLLQESPFATGINVGDYNGVFNWTSTYRTDSDSPFTYFTTSTKPSPMAEKDFTKLLEGIMTSKSKLVAYMNSNCHATHTKRLDLIRDVKKNIHVDIYGKCGQLKCPRDTKECTDKMSQYKFYFAMENANCRDYLTEKVHQPLLEWMSVPIVMGGADPSDYERILPPNSFIHTAGFPNVSDLTEYLQILDRNPTFYARHHEWRRTHQPGYNDHWCSMCRKLHNTSLPIQNYKNFQGWYEDDTCKV